MLHPSEIWCRFEKKQNNKKMKSLFVVFTAIILFIFSASASSQIKVQWEEMKKGLVRNE